MKRTFVLLACASALFLAGCTSDSKRPNPTGKGTIRAIHAIPDAGQIVFKIEERGLSNINYKQSSTPERYDDFEYNFNFDIFVPDDTDPQRIATTRQKIDADRDYVFAVTGSIDNPTITTWVADVRQWDGTETVFEARFAHLSVSLGDIDVYFHDPADLPSASNLVTTLSPGGIMNIADFAEGTYVITITTAGDPDRVPVYTSTELSYTAQTSHVISIFDGNANDSAPYILGRMTAGGQSTRLSDPTFPPTIRFVHGAQTLQAVDVYNDELLTNLVASNVTFGTATTDFLGSVAETSYYFTPPGSTATTLFSTTVSDAPPGARGNLYLLGDTNEWGSAFIAQDRAPVSTGAKISIVNTSLNHESFDLYIVDRDVPLAEDTLPATFNITFSLSSPTLQRVAGSYDVYVTGRGTKTELAGPYPLDVALGDVVFLLGADAVDPARLEIRDVSIP